MRLEPPNGFQVIPEVPAVRHQPCRVRLIDTLPPEIEKQQMIMERREVFFDFVFERAGLQLFGIFREPQIGIGSESARVFGDLFRQRQQFQKRLFRHRRSENVACRLKSLDLCCQVFEIAIELFHRVGDQIRQFPVISKLPRGSRTA